MNKRTTLRALLALTSAGVGSLWTLQPAWSQAPATVRKVAVLEAGPPGPRESFRRALTALGWREGLNLAIQFVSTQNREENIDALAATLVAGHPDAIVTSSASTTRALQKATSSIPIVMVYVVDPVGNGFAASLARPGGNITGLSNQQEDVLPKMAELLLQIAPRTRKTGFLFNPRNPALTTYKATATRAAAALGIQPVLLTAESPTAIIEAVEQGAKRGVQALVVAADPLFSSHASLLAQRINAARLPAIYGQKLHVQQGGLMSYGANRDESWLRAAIYVDKILKGTRPAEIPIEQPTRFELVVSAKAALSLGLTIPHSILLLATEVIE